MLERGDMTTLHEPFLYRYYVHEGRKHLPRFDVDPRRPVSYEDIRSMIMETARSRPVFVKDMCYYVHDRIHRDPDFIRRMTSTFLVRDPARAIPSYFRLDPSVTLEEIGYEAQHRCFERIGEITGRTPVVIDAEDLAGGSGRHAARVLPGAGARVHAASAGVERGAARRVAGRERLAHRPRRLHRYREAPPPRPAPGWTRRRTCATTTSTTCPSTASCGRIGSHRNRMPDIFPAL